MAVKRNNTLLADTALMEKFDKLRALGISQDVPLPQIVVAGDQSSGKSSLLESITGIPFPKRYGLCTRHVTQISSRRADERSVKVTISAGPNASEEHKKYVEAFREHAASGAALRQDFATILKKAHERMGLREHGGTGEGSVFSEDILKAEVFGPEEDPLTIIDVPGLFRATMGGTTDEDIAMVQELVESYIKEERTIVLAVLPSTVDVATQGILQLAAQYDRDGTRTLGVITKPDLALNLNEQTQACKLVRGKMRPLSLGYFIVRNRSEESDTTDMEVLELHFRQQPWADLPPERVGIAALKEQLQTLLIEMYTRETPKMIRDTNNQIRECQKQLESLGPPRQSEREQRSYLSQIAGSFQNHVRAALCADYNAAKDFDRSELRLITTVVHVTDIFAAEFKELAHARQFEDLSLTEGVSEDGTSDHVPEEEKLQSHFGFLYTFLGESGLQTLTPLESEELGDLVVEEESELKPQTDITEWINNLYMRSRGMDLGTFNSNLISQFFAEQSSRWGYMTGLYMGRVIVAVHRFIAAVLSSVCPETSARQKVWSSIVEILVSRYRAAMDQANLLIEVEQHNKPYTLLPQFDARLAQSSAQRLMESLRPRARKDTKQYAAPQYMVNLEDIGHQTQELSKGQKMQEHIHDILREYYNIARDRFMDNILQLAVNHHLLFGPNTPLSVFTQDWVVNLETDDLERMVGEPKHVKSRRTKLMKKHSDLCSGLKLLKE